MGCAPIARAVPLLLIAFAALTVTAVGGVALLYQNDIRSAREATKRGSLRTETDLGPIEYADRGAGPPLLSIHGAGGGFDQGLANASALVGDDFRIIAPSRFGYLGTPVPRDALPAAQADAHAALLAKLNVPKAIVVGISAGARSSVELAIRHPERVFALVLVVPGTYSPTSPVSITAGRGNDFAFWAVRNGGDFAWWAAEKVAPSTLIRFLGVRPELVASLAERDRVMALVESIEPLSLRFAGINVDGNAALHELPLKEIKAPTLIVTARDDLFNTLPAAELLARGIPGARLIVYETGGHLLVGHEHDVRSAVRNFLNGVRATSSSRAQ